MGISALSLYYIYKGPINPRSGNMDGAAMSGESVFLSKIQRGLVGPTLRGRGDGDKFFNWLKNGPDDPALHRTFVERGYSVMVGDTV